jgi:esterase/lipase
VEVVRVINGDNLIIMGFKMIDWNIVIQIVVGLVLAVGGYLYKELKSKAEKTYEEFLIYKTHVATHYVSNDKLTEAVGDLRRTVDNVASGILRIEARMNNQIDNRANNNGNHTT